MSMKIGFCGAGGSGKTTTAKALIEALRVVPGSPPGKPTLVHIPGVTRRVFEHFKITEEHQRSMTPRERWELQKQIYAAKINQEGGCAHGVFDRTPIDHMSYCLYRCAEAMSAADTHVYLNLTRYLCDRYQYIFYFPLPTWPQESDGFREDGLAYNTCIAAIIKGLLEQLDIHFHTVPEGSVEDRVEYILSTVEP